jgi:pantoate--beta-alanine ligase
MYPEGHATRVRVAGLGDVLEGEHRPGFFEGVATVVTKLLLRALPDFAVFGEKDYQQLRVIERLVSDLDIPVRIDSVAIVREPDGLALSSRNGYLTADERSLAPALYRAITVAAEAVAGGGSPAEQEEQARADLLSSGFAEVDYVAVRDAETLGPFDPARAGRVLAAARLGRARLIDNVPVP